MSAGLRDHIVRRVCIQQRVDKAVDDLAMVRHANGTTPKGPLDWWSLIVDRTTEFQDTLSARTQYAELDRELLEALQADVQGLLEQIELEASK